MCAKDPSKRQTKMHGKYNYLAIQAKKKRKILPKHFSTKKEPGVKKISSPETISYSLQRSEHSSPARLHIMQ